MNDANLRVTSEEATADSEDRFHRLRLIEWWEQEKLLAAKVLVVGAGALGNEIVKNLALLGVGNLFIADLDRIENSNLSRSILYRESDNGRPKAIAAAEAARDIFPDLRAQHFDGNVVYDLGLGVFRWADVILAGLDNREARLAINRSAWKVDRPWVDGAIEQIQGCSRVFVPDGPCYECTMSEIDWQILQKRRSCNLLSRDEMERGRTPTTPTISSIIAGVQCQEAIKLLHGLPASAGRGWFFEGLSGDSYTVEYQRKEECYSHETLDEVVSLDACGADISVADLLEEARKLLGKDVELELSRDVLEKLVCPNCGGEQEMYASLGKTSSEVAVCPKCAGVQRDAVTFYKIRGDEAFCDRSLADIGIPPFDIVIARTEDRCIGLELAGDMATVLGPLVGGEDELEWT